MRAYKILGRTFLVLISLVVTLLVAELIARKTLVNRTQSFQFIEEINEVDVTPVPYLSISGPPKIDIEDPSPFNELGYKGPLPSFEKQEGEYRIIIIGGSTVEQGDPTWPELLQKKFADENQAHIKVFNFGATSSNSVQDMLRIPLHVVQFQPDLIVSYSGGNDFLSTPDRRLGYPHRYAVFENSPLVYTNVEQYPLIDLALFGSQLLRYSIPEYFEKRFLPEEPKVYTTFGLGKLDPSLEEKVDFYLENLEKAAKISKTFGAEFLAVFQPLRDYGDQPLNMDDAQYLKSLREQLVKRATDYQVQLVDASDRLAQKESSFWMDRVHPENDSLSAVSDIMHEVLSSRVSF